jgi:hypothetical protein
VRRHNGENYIRKQVYLFNSSVKAKEKTGRRQIRVKPVDITNNYSKEF